MAKYLTEQEIDEIVGEIIIDKNFHTMSQDSYNEELIANKMKKLDYNDLCHCAINMATVGYGNQKYGQFRIAENVITVLQVFQKNNIKFSVPQSAVLKEDDLTANRLCRFFRHKIQKYIKINNVETYLWRKYSKKNKDFKHVCFRGAEYLENLRLEEADYLLDTIKKHGFKNGYKCF